MEAQHRVSAERVRRQLEAGRHDPARFRAAIREVPPVRRDAWLDLAFGVDELPDDGLELPRHCVGYLPCSVDALMRMVEHASVRASDVFVDIGSGVGRAAAFVHVFTGASVIGLEIQPRLVVASRDLAARLMLSRFSCIEGDAATLAGSITIGSVFFLYCPFSGARLATVLAGLEPIARTRPLRVCCVDLPLPPCPWLAAESSLTSDLAIYRSTQ